MIRQRNKKTIYLISIFDKKYKRNKNRKKYSLIIIQKPLKKLIKNIQNANNLRQNTTKYTMTSQQTNIIKFKSTNTSHQILQLEYDQNKSILEYKQQIAELLDYDVWNIKFVFKGKVLGDKEKAGGLSLKAATVMMVLTKPKQQKEKSTLPSSAQTIPRSNLSTGLGSSSPVGFGNYGLVNHPQYMSAISSAVDPQKMNEMLDDPFYQSMIQQMLDDPQTLKQMMQQNPMTKQLIDQNPMMKMVMSNPAMMKMVFNKQTIKMAQEMQKNGNITPQTLQQNPMAANNMMQNMFGSGLGQNTGLNPNTNNMFGGMPYGGGNPFFPMMGSGFGSNPQAQQGINFPANNNNGMPFGMLGNPFLMQQSMFNNNQPQQPQTTQQQSSSQSAVNNNSFPSLFQNLQSVMQKANQQVQYSSQLKELNSMGFGNKEKNIKFLKQSEGDIDKALEKLCLDDDQQEQSQQNKSQKTNN